MNKDNLQNEKKEEQLPDVKKRIITDEEKAERKRFILWGLLLIVLVVFVLATIDALIGLI